MVAYAEWHSVHIWCSASLRLSLSRTFTRVEDTDFSWVFCALAQNQLNRIKNSTLLYMQLCRKLRTNLCPHHLRSSILVSVVYFDQGTRTGALLASQNQLLSTSTLISPSFQGGPTIFRKGNFLKLKGVVFPHPSLSWSKERAHTLFVWINIIHVSYS